MGGSGNVEHHAAYLLSCDQKASSSYSGNSVNGMPLGVATMYPKQYACWWSSDGNVQGIGVNNIDPVLRYRFALQKVASFKNYCCICRIDGLVQDCSISIAYALELLQSCTKP